MCVCVYLQFLDLRVAVLGNVDSGKSTLLGVLTQGELDNGRGRARLNLFRHLHEIQTGRTSSISFEILGFNSKGEVMKDTRESAHFSTVRPVVLNCLFAIILLLGRKLQRVSDCRGDLWECLQNDHVHGSGGSPQVLENHHLRPYQLLPGLCNAGRQRKHRHRWALIVLQQCQVGRHRGSCRPLFRLCVVNQTLSGWPSRRDTQQADTCRASLTDCLRMFVYTTPPSTLHCWAAVA